MTDRNVHPQPPQPDPRTWDAPQQTPPVQQAPVPAPAAVPVPQALPADRAWVDGYEPGNPWEARLCVETPYGTFAYPLTPNTIPELLEQMVLVAQEQQGLPVGFDADPEAEPEAGTAPANAEHTDEDEQDQPGNLHGGRAARLTGWALVHDLWEREDPTARIVMGAIVVVLLLLGIVLS
ncbi:hypothetical protein WB401_28630 [Streptomyces brasiliscabiei]|uniref:Integral membrane protein n=1 Tax=Streptomyces brasiliscabiei TaxID=2736302 RepID=A0ABU8GLU1_9ACTN